MPFEMKTFIGTTEEERSRKLWLWKEGRRTNFRQRLWHKNANLTVSDCFLANLWTTTDQRYRNRRLPLQHFYPPFDVNRHWFDPPASLVRREGGPPWKNLAMVEAKLFLDKGWFGIKVDKSTNFPSFFPNQWYVHLFLWHHNVTTKSFSNFPRSITNHLFPIWVHTCSYPHPPFPPPFVYIFQLRHCHIPPPPASVCTGIKRSFVRSPAAQAHAQIPHTRYGREGDHDAIAERLYGEKEGALFSAESKWITSGEKRWGANGISLFTAAAAAGRIVPTIGMWWKATDFPPFLSHQYKKNISRYEMVGQPLYWAIKSTSVCCPFLRRRRVKREGGEWLQDKSWA